MTASSCPSDCTTGLTESHLGAGFSSCLAPVLAHAQMGRETAPLICTLWEAGLWGNTAIADS